MGTVTILLVTMVAAAACGSSSSSSDRIAACDKASLDTIVKGNSEVSGAIAQKIAADPKVKSAVAAICKEADSEGLLEGDGATTDATAKLMRDHPELLSPICEVAYREGLGSSVPPDVAAQIPGGLDGLAADFCRDLGPYLQGMAINWPQLYKDRGRKTFVPVCTTAAVSGAAQDPNYPFTAADSRTIFTRVCGRAWDEGYVSQDGSVDTAAVRRISRQTVRQMIRSGQIHVRQT
jgi:hypothetical protein